MDEIIAELGQDADLHGQTVMYDHVLVAQTMNPSSSLTFVECPFTDHHDRFTYAIAHEVAVALRQYYRDRGWQYVQFTMHTRDPSGEGVEVVLGMGSLEYVPRPGTDEGTEH